MKRRIRLFGILLVLSALIIMQLPVAEADAATSASDFKMEGNTLVKYRGTEKNVSVPDTVEIIGQNAFAGNTNIELVVLPKSVKEIEAYAFWGCENLDNVVLGKGLTEVGDYVFTNCKGLQKMSIPSNIKSIGIKAFADCVNLTDITIAPEVYDIHETAFDGCYKLLIHCESGTAADQYAEAFYERQKEMPEYQDVQKYPSEEEKDNQQKDDQQDNQGVIIPEESYGDTIGATQVVGNRAVVFIDNTSLQVQNGKEDMTELEATKQDNEGNGSIPKYTIVDNRIVADQAYYRNQKLQKVVLPSDIEEIGQFAFARSSVSKVSIPEGTGNIGYGAFYHCDNLQEVELPQTIVCVEPKAFDFTAWVENFMENGTEDFLMSGGVLVAYRGSKSQVFIPDGVRVIAGEAFADHSEIEEVLFADSVKVIGEAAFAGCSHLRKIHLNSQLNQIKDRAFQGCDISEVTVPASVETMGIKAFEDNVQINYEGEHIPETSHELSAERLSNESYRSYKEEQSASGVTVTGIEGSIAHLEGATRSYLLSIEETEDKDEMEKAFMRCFQSKLPDDMVLYTLELTDNSNISITKLGKQALEIIMPVTAELQSRNLILYSLDRNGQLEEKAVERVKLDGVDCIRFQVNFLSQIGITSDGTDFDNSFVMEETTTVMSMSNAPKKTNPFFIRWIFCGAIFIGGMTCIFWRKL